MFNEKLQLICQKLNVSTQDIDNIKKERIKRKILYPIVGAIVAICSFVLGFSIGKANPIEICDNCGGYPYGAAGLVSMSLTSKSQKRFILITIAVTILVSVIGFVAAYKVGQPIFHVALKYNVFSRRK